ncbi:MAG: hypothetical protein AAGM67_10190 [Bacteroidota bacterium]
MPAAISLSVRQLIHTHRQSGQTLEWIAQEVGLPYGTVQRLCARFRESPSLGLSTAYGNCGKKRRDERDLVFRAVRCMKQWHPSWGAEKIRTELLLLRPSLQIPQARMLQKWFHWNGQVAVRPALKASKREWAKVVDQGWQIDAKENVSIESAEKMCWLNIIDECSGGVIDAGVFPLQEDLSSPD